MVVVIYTLLLLYSVTLFICAYGFQKIQEFTVVPGPAQIPICIIICARNEENFLPLCLKSILAQNYNKQLLQIILVNDASSDNTQHIANTFLDSSNIDHLILNNSEKLGKKASITKAIQHAKFNTIVTRDADTFTTSTLWLQNLSQFQVIGNYDFVIGPVNIADNRGLLWALQCVENRVLVLLSAATSYFKMPFLCSGANLLFTKTIFEKADGYKSHDKIESGDDVLFLEDVKKIEGAKIGFIKSKEAVVFTYPQYGIHSLLIQKVRWAKKFQVNSNFFNLGLSLLTFAVNIIWTLSFIGFFLHLPFHNYFLLFMLLKLLPELFLLFLSGKFMSNKHLFWYALAVALVYPFYAVWVALLSLFLQPKWK